MFESCRVHQQDQRLAAGCTVCRFSFVTNLPNFPLVNDLISQSEQEREDTFRLFVSDIEEGIKEERVDNLYKDERERIRSVDAPCLRNFSR
jgi:Cys-tRNA synthase (O-phospho-L-seryl-tRNA:Cys-tRNA synthase)